MLRPALACLLLALPAAAWAQGDCGGADAPCTIDGGEYFVALPEEPAGAPAVVYLYGYGGAGTRTMGNEAFLARFTARGYAAIVPEGVPWQPGEPNGWNFRAGDYDNPRDDVAFIRAVIDDAAARFGLDRSRVLLTGFSIGGSMTWDIACLAPDTAAAYAPVSGGFWNPLPTACAAPVHMLHAHGFTDPVVPLEGRPIGDGDFQAQQGDIYAGLAIWRRTMGCGTRADAYDIQGEIWRKSWTDCAAGGSLGFVLHPGEHSIPPGWHDMALDWFEDTIGAE